MKIPTEDFKAMLLSKNRNLWVYTKSSFIFIFCAQRLYVSGLVLEILALHHIIWLRSPRRTSNLTSLTALHFTISNFIKSDTFWALLTFDWYVSTVHIYHFNNAI